VLVALVAAVVAIWGVAGAWGEARTHTSMIPVTGVRAQPSALSQWLDTTGLVPFAGTPLAEGLPGPAEFPSVTVCSSSGFSRERLEQAGRWQPGNELAKLRAVGRTAEETVLGCTFAGMRCDAAGFTVVQSPQHGNCFTFNADSTTLEGVTYGAAGRPPLASSSTSPDQGLTLTLRLGHLDAWTRWDANSSLEGARALAQASSVSEGWVNASLIPGIAFPTESLGVVISVHPRESLPVFEGPGTTGVLPGTASKVSFARTDRYRLQRPHGVCSRAVSSSERPLCISRCEAQALVSQCSCHMPGSALDTSTVPVCSAANPLHRQCLASVELTDVKHGCSSTGSADPCPLACADSTFLLSHSSLALQLDTGSGVSSAAGASALSSTLRNAISSIPSLLSESNLVDRTFVNRGIAVVTVYPRSLQATAVEDAVTMTPIVLLAVMGGILSLFLGASVMSVLEVLEFLVLAVWVAVGGACSAVAWLCCSVPAAIRRRRASVDRPTQRPKSALRSSAPGSAVSIPTGHPGSSIHDSQLANPVAVPISHGPLDRSRETNGNPSAMSSGRDQVMAMPRPDQFSRFGGIVRGVSSPHGAHGMAVRSGTSPTASTVFSPATQVTLSSPDGYRAELDLAPVPVSAQAALPVVHRSMQPRHDSAVAAPSTRTRIGKETPTAAGGRGGQSPRRIKSQPYV
jgi:hypothetical protein